MKNSTLNRNSRYVSGGITEVTPRFLNWWERYEVENDISDIAYRLEEKYVGRLDLLAHAFYGDTNKQWMILQYNDILDPDIEMISGKILLMPTPDKLSEAFKIGILGGIK